MLPATTRLAPALDYPTRPVHLIEGFGAGGAPDQQYCRRGGGAGTPGWLHRRVERRKVTRTELIVQLLKIAIGLVFGAYFVWWSLQVLDRLTPD